MKYIKETISGLVVIKIILLVAVYVYITYGYLSFEVFKVRGGFWVLSVIWGFVAFLMLQNIRLQKKKTIQVCNIIEILIIPIASVFVIEIMCNPLIDDLKPRFLLCNYLLLLVIELLLIVILGCRKGLYATTTAVFLFGTVNYFVIKFKGTPLMPSDITAVKTVINVVDHYEFSVTQEYMTSFLIYIFEICLIKIIGENTKNRNQKNILKKLLIFLIYFPICIFLFNLNYLEILDLSLNGWNLRANCYVYGSLFAFLLETQELRPEKVQGYSVAKAKELLNTQETDALTSSVIPNIIIIMNESFSDLSVRGDINTDQCLYNWNNADYIMRGYAYSSVYGGMTCNSEFEMLTGSSMAFISSGSPYQSYNLKDVWNMADVLRENGYSTIALHPAAAGNWNREKVYDNLGFDKFISIKDFINPAYYHGYVSDRAVYEKITEIIESKDSPLFLFGITMQNHGGYNLDTLGDSPLINIEEKYSQYEQAITYMTLIQESDAAFKELYDYFTAYDEPTIVCMFGDHQPALDEKFLNALQMTNALGENEIERAEVGYKVPYIIFSNYDLAESNIVKDISINYLGAIVLRLAGHTNPYFDCIANMQKNIPIINARGYMTNDGVWHQVSEPNDDLAEYEMVQYYNLFDKKRQ